MFLLKKAIILIIVLAILTAGFLIYQSQGKETELSDKNLSERIGQMLMVGFRGTEVTRNSEIINSINSLNLGGVVLFDYDIPSKSSIRNITSPVQTMNLTEDLQKFTNENILIAVDAEGGQVNRLKPSYGFLDIPSPQEVVEKYGLEKAREIYLILAFQLSELGFNMNLAPVVDLNLNPANPVIGSLERSFSSETSEVMDYASAFIEAHQQKNILTSLKHFPGHGSSQEDSHLGLTDVTETYQTEELEPFRELINKGLVDTIMTAHIMNKNIDPDYPATLSVKFITEILRNQLNYQGVVISDDMNMKAITDNFGFRESIIKAVNAGCDIILLSNNGETYDENIAQKAHQIIFEAVKSGEIEPSRIIEASNRVYFLKENLEN